MRAGARGDVTKVGQAVMRTDRTGISRMPELVASPFPSEIAQSTQNASSRRRSVDRLAEGYISATNDRTCSVSGDSLRDDWLRSSRADWSLGPLRKTSHS